MLSAILLVRLPLFVPVLVGVSFLFLISGCTSSLSRRQPAPLSSAPPVRPQTPVQPKTKGIGIASWYGPGFHGQPTASGEIYNQNALTAAHRTLPLGSRVQVTNLTNGKSVQVRITDRGPFIRGRAIDLSRGAAHKLGMVKSGLSRVRIQPLPAHSSKSIRSSPSRQQRSLTQRRRRVRRPPSPAAPERSRRPPSPAAPERMSETLGTIY